MMKKLLLLICVVSCLSATSRVEKSNPLDHKPTFKICVVKWSFRMMTSKLCEYAKEAGIDAMDMLDEGKWPVVKQAGMKIVVADGADMGIWGGFCEEELHKQLQSRYLEILPKLSQYGITRLICYAGKNTTMSDQEALEVCARGLLPVVREAEKHGVTLVMALLSSSDKGGLFSKMRFPHYQCDNPEWGVKLCDRIASPNFRLCYKVWHMVDMDRDVPADIAKYAKYIAHYHISGTQTKGENRYGPFSDYDRNLYQKMFCELQKSGYNGYLGLEFDRIYENITDVLKASMEFIRQVQ